MANSVTSRTGSRLTSRRSSLRSARSLSHSKRNSRQPSATTSGTKKPRGTPKDPIHILTRDTPIGWAVIQKAVDDFDKEETEAVKNDIDTLLVFNGLFSAVLSAFFVLAIALLQEDIPGATLTTLRYMSAQNANYTIQGDFIHSTSPAPTSFPQFEPSVNAIRINDLWTASLIISLITASFGILVKQWLREYTKFVTSFPQGRLRIRNFRRDGLETWKVLTIAACLPLLLQLALGLFFIGLCFYTAELHSSVRNTTLPLVTGWGFIFFFVTVSPLFSDHCPYKTPALNSLMVAIRAYVRARWISRMKALQRSAYRVWRWTPSRFSTLKKIADMIGDWAGEYVGRLQKPARPHSEAAATTHEAGDLDIMADADKLQGNDEIVGTAMVDALQQITPKPEQIIKFVLQILQHRVPWEGNFEKEPQIIDCSMATSRALDSIHSILEQRLRINDIVITSATDFESGQVASWTAALYLSLWTHGGFEKAHSPLWESLNKKPEIFAAVAVSLPSPLGLRVLLRLTCQSCQESKLDLAQSLIRIQSVVDPSFQKLGLTDSFESDNDDAPWRKVLNEGSLRDTVVFLTDLLRNDTAAQDGEWSDAQHGTLSLIINLIATRPWGFMDSIAAVWRMTLSSKSDAVVVKLLTLFIKPYPLSFYLYMNNEDFRTDTAALSRVAAAIETIATNSPGQLTRLSVLEACYSLARSLYHAKDDVKSTALTDNWRGVVAALTSLVQAAPVLEGQTGEEADEIESCFFWLSHVDARNEDDDREDEGKYSEWRAAFKPEESPIPDGFYLTLMDISIPTRRRFWRMRRLQEMTVEGREEARKDVKPHLRKYAARNLDNSVAGRSTGRGERSGVGVGAADGPAGVDAPDDAEEGKDPSNGTEHNDSPGGTEGRGGSGSDSEIVAEGPEPGANVASAVEPDGGELGLHVKHSVEQEQVAYEDTARWDSAAAGPAGTRPPESAPSEVGTVDINLGVLEGEHGERELGSLGHRGELAWTSFLDWIIGTWRKTGWDELNG